MAKGVKGFQKGVVTNPNGRPADPLVAEFRKIVEKIRTPEGRTLMEHFCDKALTDNTVLVALQKKILPDKKQIDADIQGNVIFEVVDFKPKSNKEKELK